MALSTTSTTAVVPFDESCQEGIMPSIIMVIPTGFITASLRLALDVELGSHHKQGGSFYWRQYKDSEHFKTGQTQDSGTHQHDLPDACTQVSIHIHTRVT